jgi:hypothetical protein
MTEGNELDFECDEDDNCYLTFRGTRIAKRQEPGVWISLEPGWTVITRRGDLKPGKLQHLVIEASYEEPSEH